jgi:hypothetical protein
MPASEMKSELAFAYAFYCSMQTYTITEAEAYLPYLIKNPEMKTRFNQQWVSVANQCTEIEFQQNEILFFYFNLYYGHLFVQLFHGDFYTHAQIYNDLRYTRELIEESRCFETFTNELSDVACVDFLKKFRGNMFLRMHYFMILNEICRRHPKRIANIVVYSQGGSVRREFYEEKILNISHGLVHVVKSIEDQPDGIIADFFCKDVSTEIKVPILCITPNFCANQVKRVREFVWELCKK